MPVVVDQAEFGQYLPMANGGSAEAQSVGLKGLSICSLEVWSMLDGVVYRNGWSGSDGKRQLHQADRPSCSFSKPRGPR